MRRWLLAAFGVACVFAGACLLEIPDVKDGSVDGSSDSTSDISLPDVLIPMCDAACGAPAGFQPLLFALNRSTSCPTGTQSTDLAADPGTIPATACTCDCNVASPPACTPSTLAHTLDQLPSFDGGYVCNSSGSDQLVDGGCNAIDAAGGIHIYPAWAVPPIAPAEAGTCTSTPITNVSIVPSTPSRVCIDPTCNTCTAPAGFRACVFASSGKVACPAGYPEQHQVGTVGLNCSGCNACSVSLDGGCRGSVTLYQDNACIDPLETIPVEGGCAANSANGASAGSIRYTPALSGLTCTPGTSNGGTVALGGELTVCCP